MQKAKCLYFTLSFINYYSIIDYFDQISSKTKTSIKRIFILINAL